MWTINFKMLKKAKDIGHCLCDLSKPCPCTEFVTDQCCQCGVFKRVVEKV